MKKVDPKALEKMAKDKNIDKDKIEKIADSYKGKSESELIDELVKIGKTLEGKEEVISKFKTFLDENQRKKLDSIMNKISESELKDKLESKKSKNKKSVNTSSPKELTSSDSNPSKTKKVKKVKKVVKKTKKS
ncbi:hypothetical protein HF520_02640 [Romboutsia sp. CE17]|uniref:hypothetical protein n=1 Tax=Romboutsia sp. CE17 TaxID=2724150 RepID=UPI001442DBDC|nr:hypothetical protein [Romboutsia sp. CE17]QJA07906.1 hypothetical protein HF520_02640 [Romboutsia sp. CE17]